jgi:hypothetical protein
VEENENMKFDMDILVEEKHLLEDEINEKDKTIKVLE